MVRIEGSPSGDAGAEQLKKELKKELKPRMGRGKLFGCGGCCLVSLAFFAAVIFGGGWLVARTGLIYIPNWSERFYEKPDPVRRVVSERGAESVKNALQNRIQTTIQKSLKPENLDGNITFPLTLSEEELTVLIREGIKTSGNETQAEGAQVAVTSEYAELYIPLQADARVPGVAILRFVPELQDGKLALAFVSFQVGEVPLPSVLGKTLLSAFGKTVLKEMEKSISEFGTLQSVALEEGELGLTLEVNVQALR